MKVAARYLSVHDPWTTLRLAGSLVNDAGSVVVSIPHASHAAILSCLLTNNFDYRDWGLLDRTHIRFFSMKNIQQLFERADFPTSAMKKSSTRLRLMF